MAELRVDLEHGVKIGEQIHHFVLLKELTPGDLINAGMESERVVETAEGYVFAVSPTLMGINTLMRQIDAIGTYDGPVNLNILGLFHREDFELLQYKAEQIDMAVMEAVQIRGRYDASESESGRPDGQV